jgi:hypothetical protein
MQKTIIPVDKVLITHDGANLILSHSDTNKVIVSLRCTEENFLKAKNALKDRINITWN